MRTKIYQVDAFTSRLFGGNPAAVCPLHEWLDEQTMQKIAAENNLSETAFFAEEGNGYRIRWFTPQAEVDLCGHATLASAHVLFHHENYSGDTITFQSKSGELSVRKEGDFLILNFPADQPDEVPLPQDLADALNQVPQECHKGRSDYLLVFESEQQVRDLQPDFSKMKNSGVRGVIVSAPGSEVDFVSRFFAPAVGIDEDPVTGSAHTTLAPYWANRLNKTELSAQQISKRLGKLKCSFQGERVEIAGQAVTYLVGEIEF